MLQTKDITCLKYTILPSHKGNRNLFIDNELIILTKT
jgi:hypothetical protein